MEAVGAGKGQDTNCEVTGLKSRLLASIEEFSTPSSAFLKHGVSRYITTPFLIKFTFCYLILVIQQNSFLQFFILNLWYVN